MHEINLAVMSLSAMTAVVVLAKHFQLYKKALSLLAQNGENVKMFELGVMGYGSGGAVSGIKLLLNSESVSVSPEVKKLLILSKKLYYLVPLSFLPMLLLMVFQAVFAE